MAKGRYYGSGTEKALFLLSRGRCYEPDCQQRVIRNLDGTPMVNVEIAHISAHEEGGLRWDDSLTDEYRRSFRNLILLCGPHHKIVDNKKNLDKYPIEVLQDWKDRREAGSDGAFEGLDGLTPDLLGQMLVDSVAGAKVEILVAISRVEKVSQDAADKLRILVSETFDRPYLDMDAVASLSHSSRMLVHLQDTAPSLSQSASMLFNVRM